MTVGIRFSRNGMTHPLGKLTAEFPKFKAPEETKAILERKAARLGMSLAEYMRELAMVDAHGADTLKSLYVQRVDVVAGTGEKKG